MKNLKFKEILFLFYSMSGKKLSKLFCEKPDMWYFNFTTVLLLHIINYKEGNKVNLSIVFLRLRNCDQRGDSFGKHNHY